MDDGTEGKMTEKEFQQYKDHRNIFYIEELRKFGKSLGVSKDDVDHMQFLTTLVADILRVGETSMVVVGVDSPARRIRIMSNALALMLKQLDLELQDREQLGVH
jgi:hypothetical protein